MLASFGVCLKPDPALPFSEREVPGVVRPSSSEVCARKDADNRIESIRTFFHRVVIRRQGQMRAETIDDLLALDGLEGLLVVRGGHLVRE